jgi:predicted nucleic acid-binding Zn ribbon protein
MVVITCPICEEDVDVGGTLFEGDMVGCDSCGEILELKRDRKRKWSLLLVEEDWEEDN